MGFTLKVRWVLARPEFAVERALFAMEATVRVWEDRKLGFVREATVAEVNAARAGGLPVLYRAIAPNPTDRQQGWVLVVKVCG